MTRAGLGFFLVLVVGCGGGGETMSGADAGRGDAGGSMATCPCFGATEVAAIEAHATAGGMRGCDVGVVSAGAISSALSSSMGPQVLQVTAQQLDVPSGTQHICVSGCSDLNDDTIDDCAGAALGASESMIITEAQYAACEAVIAAACM